MKRIIALILCLAMMFAYCGMAESAEDIVYSDPIGTYEPVYTGLNDSDLLAQIEDQVYAEAVSTLDSDEYVVESVHARFISKEYLEETIYNSQSNVFFGYTLAELNDLFQGERYVFTLGEDGLTTVKKMEVIEDTSTETILKNVAIGTGVILVCVTVSCLTAGAAPAVSVIFAASAKTATVMAASSGALGAVSAGVVRCVETGDLDESLKAAALAGSEGFKWGAISGALVGGGNEAYALKVATKGGLSMNEVALIQRESMLPMRVISEFHSLDEYNLYKDAGLRPFMVNSKTALIQDIDLSYVSELPDGTKVTNLARMQRGYAPLDPATDKAYQLHHIGQKAEATLAILTEEQHQGNSAILNIVLKESEIDRNAFAAIRKEFWKSLGNAFAAGVV